MDTSTSSATENETFEAGASGKSKHRKSTASMWPSPVVKPHDIKPQRNAIPPGELGRLISTLSPSGIIHRETGTNFWSIVMDDSWQQAEQDIVRLCQSQYDPSPWAINGKRRAQEWYNLIHNHEPEHKSSEDVSWVSPPSVAGLHISLGKFDDDTSSKTSAPSSSPRRPRPPGIVEGERIHLCLGDIVEFSAARPLPVNLPGQFTDSDGLRFYPTHWVFVNVEFDNLDYKPMYPPHISIACIATKLPVDHVSAFHEQRRQEEEIERQQREQEENEKPKHRVEIENASESETKVDDDVLTPLSIGIPLGSAAPSNSSSSVSSNISLSSNTSFISLQTRKATNSIDSTQSDNALYSPLSPLAGEGSPNLSPANPRAKPSS